MSEQQIIGDQPNAQVQQDEHTQSNEYIREDEHILAAYGAEYDIRMSAGADFLGLDVEEGAGDLYELLEVWTTQNGSWENKGALYNVPDWARERYLRPLGAPDYFDDAGADHHLFARVVDEQGAPLAVDVQFWSGPKPEERVTFNTGVKKSGWANTPIWSSFNKARDGRGAWRWAPVGAADVLVGGGLPDNLHVSSFAVWRKRSGARFEPWRGRVKNIYGLNLRATANYGEILTTLPDKTDLLVIGAVGEWLQVRVAQRTGWVFARFVERVDDNVVLFERALAWLLEEEGGYQERSTDPGNWTGCAVGNGELRGTKYGISACAYPELDIASLTEAQAAAIYRRDFWTPTIELQLGDDRLTLLHFDTAVQHGLPAAEAILKDVRVSNQPLTTYFALRLELYARQSNMALADFGAGWLRRMASLMREVGLYSES